MFMKCVIFVLFLTTLALSGCGRTAAPGYGVASLDSPAGIDSAEPHLAGAADGTVVLSWLRRNGSETSLNFSTLKGRKWRTAQTITKGDDWFVNWADFPSVVPISNDLWAAHWLVRRAGGAYAYDVALALSQDAGRQWSDAITPHTDGTATEHGFVSLFPWNHGVGALWLDGRNMTAAADATGHQHGEVSGGGMTLRAVTVTPNGGLHNPQQLDDLVCDCCQTDVAIGAKGPIVVYRNRTAEEIRDIYVKVARDGHWQPAVPVANDGWEISGCPVNGPAVAAAQNQVAVAWFTGANESPRVRLALSQDSGRSFSAAVDIDAEKPVGRVDVELLDGGAAVVSWLRPAANGGGELCVRRVSAAGEMQPVRVVASTSTARQSGFPQMLRRGDELVFAWTDAASEVSAIRTALLPINRL